MMVSPSPPVGEEAIDLTDHQQPPDRLSDVTALSAGLVGKEASARSSSTSLLSYLVGRSYTIYIVEVAYKGKTWVVKKRYSDFYHLYKQHLKECRMMCPFPRKSLLAKLGLSRALEKRQAKLNDYVVELMDKLGEVSQQNNVLEFFDVVVPLDTRSRSATNRTNSIGGSLHIDLIEEDALVEVEMGPQPASPNDIMVNDTLADAVTPSRAARPHQDHSIIAVPLVSPLSVSGSLEESKDPIARVHDLLRSGIVVIKHCRGATRFGGASVERLLYCNEEFTNVCWSSFTWQSKISSIRVSDIVEVRQGTSPDPKNPGKKGTEVLRRTASKDALWRCFSLLTPDRSLDIELKDDHHYEVLVEGFRALVVKNETEAKLMSSAA